MAARKRFHVSRAIDAPPEAAWRLLADADTWKDWNPTVISIKGPIRKGDKVELVSTLNPKRTFKLTVSELDAGARRMVWSDGMPLGLFAGVRTYTVEPDGDGARFTMTEEYSGPMAPLVTRAIPDMSQSFEDFADGLKAGAESA